MSPPFAHVAGIPLEEGLVAVVPAALAGGLIARAWLAEIAAWLRRR